MVREFAYTEPELEGLKGGDYCQGCNNRWMQELDCAVEGTVGRLMEGKTTWLAPADQLLIATWATKVALVWESTQGNQRSVPDNVYRTFYDERQPVSGYPVDLARYAGKEVWHRCYSVGHGVGPEGSMPPQVEFVLLTIVAGQVVAHVVLPGNAAKPFEQDLPPEFWVSIWPRSWRRELWPPSRGLDDDAFAEIFPSIDNLG